MSGKIPLLDLGSHSVVMNPRDMKRITIINDTEFDNIKILLTVDFNGNCQLIDPVSENNLIHGRSEYCLCNMHNIIKKIGPTFNYKLFLGVGPERRRNYTPTVVHPYQSGNKWVIANQNPRLSTLVHRYLSSTLEREAQLWGPLYWNVRHWAWLEGHKTFFLIKINGKLHRSCICNFWYDCLCDLCRNVPKFF